MLRVLMINLIKLYYLFTSDSVMTQQGADTHTMHEVSIIVKCEVIPIVFDANSFNRRR